MKAKTTIKNVLFTIAFPVIMFLAMWIISAANGKEYVNSLLFIYVEKYMAISTIMALAIFSQFRNGRFDFSGGSVVVLSSIIAGNIAHFYINDNKLVYMLLCIVLSLLMCMIVATVYCFSRVPIVIISIAMALVFEAITYLVFKGEGINILSSGLGKFYGSGIITTITSKEQGMFPGVYIPFIIAVVVFVVFQYKTIWGKQATMLANNQKVACNIGISEIKNVYATYVVTGILLGLGATIYGVTNKVTPQANLSTAGVLFQYIVPVFMGMFFGSKSRDYIGIIVAAIGLGFLNQGLNTLGVGGGGIQQIIMGVFTLAIYALSSQMGNITRLINFIKSKFTKKEKANV